MDRENKMTLNWWQNITVMCPVNRILRSRGSLFSLCRAEFSQRSSWLDWESESFAIMICRSVCQIIYGNMRWVKQSTSSALQRFLSLNHPIIHDTYINKLPVVFIICVYRSDLDCCVRLIIFTRELINHISLSHCSRSTFDIFSTGSWLDETFLHCYFDALFTLHTQGQNTIDYSQGPLSLLFILLKKITFISIHFISTKYQFFKSEEIGLDLFSLCIMT